MTAAYKVIKFVSGDTKTSDTTQRVAVISYKGRGQKEKKESKAVLIPIIDDSMVLENVNALLPHIKNLLEDAQNKIIREKIDSGSTVILDHEIDMNAVIEYLNESSNGGRLTKELISSWFSQNVEEYLMLTLAEKLGVSEEPSEEESIKIEKITSEFKDKISALAGGKTYYEPKVCESLKKCIALGEFKDEIGEKLLMRLDNMMKKEEENKNIVDLL